MDCLYKYVLKCFETNSEYIQEDLEWMMLHFNEAYPEFILNINSLYTMLSLINLETFCGYFSITYNNSLAKYVKERDAVSFRRTLLNPKFYEVEDNKYLTDEEKKELMLILNLESMVANLVIKRSTIRKDIRDLCSEFTKNKKRFYLQIDKLYKESYDELYEKIFSNISTTQHHTSTLKIFHKEHNEKSDFRNIKIKAPCKSGFQNIVFISELDSETQNNHIYTYKLMDILKQCIYKDFKIKFSPENIENINTRFDLEIRLVHHSLEV